MMQEPPLAVIDWQGRTILTQNEHVLGFQEKGMRGRSMEEGEMHCHQKGSSLEGWKKSLE